MRKRTALVLITGSAVPALCLLCLLVASGESEPPTAGAAAAGSTPPPGAGTLITPQREDFPRDVLEKKHLRLPVKRQARLGPLRPGTHLVNALGGGEGIGPVGTGSRPPAHWHTWTRYVIYAASQDARANAFEEDRDLRAAGLEHGSFSGATIGDLCGHISDPRLGFFELHFVRHNVSVTLTSRVPDWAGADPEVVKSARKELQSEIEPTLETAARVIITRIDAVVKAKGKVGLGNLPPIQPRTGSLNAIPNRPPGAKPK